VTQHFHRSNRPYDVPKLATGNFRNCDPLGGEASPPKTPRSGLNWEQYLSTQFMLQTTIPCETAAALIVVDTPAPAAIIRYL